MSESFDPHRMGQVLHEAMEEILGAEGTRSLMEDAGADFSVDGAFSVAKLGRGLAALEQRYGELAGRGIAQRVGRACFRYGLREYGDALGVTSTSFRLLPFPSKLKTFAGNLAGMFNSISDRCVRVEEGEGRLCWVMEDCPFCQDKHASESACLLPVGLAEEALYWLSGGKMFSVEESACIARGDAACIVQVDATPLS